MSPVVTIVVPSLILGLAYTLARREWRLYRTSHGDNDHDVFVYTRGRLVRRMTGVAVLVGLAATFVALGFLPPKSPGQAQTYLAVFAGEIAILLVLPIWDLVETARTARPGRGLKFGRPPDR